jgi:hypothetical protein
LEWQWRLVEVEEGEREREEGWVAGGLRGCLVANHILTHLRLGKYGKEFGYLPKNLVTTLFLSKGILPHFFLPVTRGAQKILPKLSYQPNTYQLDQTCLKLGVAKCG